MSGGDKCYVILKYGRRVKIHQSRTGVGEEDGFGVESRDRVSRDSCVLALSGGLTGVSCIIGPSRT